jgi:hypothetical protein
MFGFNAFLKDFMMLSFFQMVAGQAFLELYKILFAFLSFRPLTIS